MKLHTLFIVWVSTSAQVYKCIVLLHFIFTILMYMLRTFNSMFHCICMYVDVWFASVRPK